MNERDYKQILREELAERCRQNPKYSLRAFARDLKISAPRLSHVLNGKHGLSPQAAQQVARRLGWSEGEAEVFSQMVAAKHARSKKAREQARKALESQTKPSEFQKLSLDSFKLISDWYHMALLELTKLEGFRPEPTWIARALNISLAEAQVAIERLVRLQALESDHGTLKCAADFTINPAGISSDAVRVFHRGVLTQAQEALRLQPVEKRDFSAMILAVDESALPEARVALKRFRRQFNDRFSTRAAKKNRVYCLSMQLFAMSKETE